MRVPGLHVVTDDEVLASHGFRERALRLLNAHGPAIALHLRGHDTPAAALYELAASLAPAAGDAGGVFLVNDRADIALAVNADGVQLGTRSLPVAAARALDANWLVGASVHDASEAAAAAGADFLVLGTIWSTASHPGRSAAGVEAIRQVRERVGVPIIAIGGVTPARAAEARTAGAAGVAVLRGVWRAEEPARAVSSYLEALAAGAAEGGA